MTAPIDLIRKLLNLANDKAATPAEAATAAAKAAKLLADHNLSVAEVEAQTGEKSEAYGRQDMAYGGRKSEEAWRVILQQAVARNNFCRGINLVGQHKSAFIGKKSNIDVAEYMYEYLAATIQRLAVSAWKALDEKPTREMWERGRYDGNGAWRSSGYRSVNVSPETWRRAFCLGAVDVIRERLIAESQTFERQSEATRALVTTSSQELIAAFKRAFPEATTRKSAGGSKIGSALAAGRAAGAGIAMRRGVTGSSNPQGRLALAAGA